MPLTESESMRILSNITGPGFDETCLILLIGIDTQEEMLSFLKALENVVHALEGSNSSSVYETMLFLCQNKLALFLLTIYSHENFHFINFLSKSATNYQAELIDQDISDLSEDSPLVHLFRVFCEYGPSAMAICASFVRIPDNLMRQLIESYLYNTDSEDNLFMPESFKAFSLIYADLTSSVASVSRIAEFLLSNDWIFQTYAFPAPVLWEGLNIDQIPLFLPVFKIAYSEFSGGGLVVSRNDQFCLFKEMISNDVERDRNWFASVSISPDFISQQVDESELIILQNQMFNHILQVLDNCKDSDLYIPSYGGIEKLFQNVLSSTQMIELSKKISDRSDIVRIFDSFTTFIKPADFLRLLHLKLFKGQDNEISPYTSLPESWLQLYSKDLTKTERRQVMTMSRYDMNLFSGIFRSWLFTILQKQDT
jgi:hypothetical protein